MQFENILRVKEIIDNNSLSEKTVEVGGWVRFFRNNQFVALNDGSCLENLQLVLDNEKFANDISKINVGASIWAKGVLKQSLGKGQSVELIVSEINIVGESDGETFPLQPKKHSLEFLREISHLRPRTNTFAAIFRVRHHLSNEIHNYFHNNGFFNLHSPIITASDCEGAGELFEVSVANKKKEEYFFNKQAFLTVSGQLEAEIAAMGLGQVYTFGPTFRAENSNTSRHLAEFWMIEPEAIFYDLERLMNFTQNFIQSILSKLLENCKEDLEFLEKRRLDESKQQPDKRIENELPLIEKLNFIVKNDFIKISYTEAIDILRNCNYNKKKKFQYTIKDWGVDLQSEHERYLVEKYFSAPVIIYDYPEDIKSFYMRKNDDGKTVAAMDVLFPGIGEIVGGAQREERQDILLEKMKNKNINPEQMSWYLDTRRFGTVPHAGFGLGFERLVSFVTGMSNVRDVILSPRAANYISF